MWHLFLAGLAASLLAACVTDQGTQRNVNVEQPVSQQTAVGDARQRAKVHTELGSLYMQESRLPVALEEARIAINADSSYAPAYNLLGLAHMFLGENKLAEENLRKALSLAPNDAEINNNFGWFLCQTGRETASMSHFQLAMRSTLYQTPTKPYTNAGICALRIKDYKSAEEYLNIALRYDGSNTQAVYWLGELFFKTDRLIEARVKVAELSRTIDPTVEVVWLGLRIEHKLGDREAELRYSMQMRRRFTTTPEYQKLLQGQYE